jgi:DNA helicase-4
MKVSTYKRKKAEAISRACENRRQREVAKQKELRNALIALLDKEEFAKADELSRTSSSIPKDEYEELKSQYVGQYIKKFGLDASDEQALAIAKIGKNLLLKARAGSGKTTVIAYKTMVLLDKENVKPDHILILTFNRTAAKEIGDRIRKKLGFKNFNNARTFHSLAYQLVQPGRKPLFDEKGDPSVKKLSGFVQERLRAIWNPVFQSQMYLFFRREMREMESSGTLLNERDYHIYRRNLPQISLGGEKVKSVGEKYIADFLFEHGISYQYERIWIWGKRLYRPDFSIYHQRKKFVIEHWGIDEYDPKRAVPNRWSQNWDEYFAEMQEKRKFWKGQKEITLIETSVRDLGRGREAYESTLKEKLENAGIGCRKLPDEEIQRKVVKIHLTRMTELFVQFIQRAKKQRLTSPEAKKKISDINDTRTKVFWELACRIYSEYQKALNNSGNFDFDDLLESAIRVTDETEGNRSIRIRNQVIKMNDLRWIMIDEYQDFSKLFYELIRTIKRYNKSVMLFCVGDDWQAINGFAGSDLHYFRSFCSLFEPEESETATLLTNRRSSEVIVRNANALMKGLGEESEHLPDNRDGEVIIEYVDDVWVERRSGEEFASGRASDDRFFFFTERHRVDNNSLILAKYLKKCHEIIANNLGKQVTILSRTGEIYGVELAEFLRKLKSCFDENELAAIGDFRDRIQTSTVHSYKGLEADVVIIPEVCTRSFPLIHPDSVLFFPFGQTGQDILDEERRLFYVAITRAREKLWILSERQRESDFLDFLKPTKWNKYSGSSN